MKKSFIPILAIPLVLVGLIATRSSTYSASDLPYPDPTKDGAASVSVCEKTTANNVFLMRKAWAMNLDALMAQEKPTSEKVDDGYESLRTYRCWLDYLCEAVLYSGNANERKTLKDWNNPNSGQRPLTKAEIDPLPGCASPSGIEIPGVKLEFIPACQVSRKDTASDTQVNFSDCRNLVKREFSGDPGTSSAFITLNKALQSDSAEGEIRPMREKFTSILVKMLAMEDRLTTLKEQILTLDNKLPCFISICD